MQAGKNCLVNPSKWDDPFENFFLQCDCVNSRGEKISLHSLRADWYGQCWTTIRDSDAMWRIYSPCKDGARARTTIRKLFDSFYDQTDDYARLRYFVGAVGYEDRASIENFLMTTSFQDLAFGGMPHNFARTLCIKRPEFEHEREVRLLYQDIDPKCGAGGLAFFPFAYQSILEEIALDPRLLPADFSAAETQLRSLGCTLPIAQSDLYQFAPVTIRLC